MQDINLKFKEPLTSYQHRELLKPSLEEWLREYIKSSSSIRVIHRWNFNHQSLHRNFDIEPLSTVFKRYLNHLHDYRFHSPEPVLHLDSDLLWILWFCEKNADSQYQLCKSALNLFCSREGSDHKLYFDSQNKRVRISGKDYTILYSESNHKTLFNLIDQTTGLRIKFDSNSTTYKAAVRSREIHQLDFTPALIPNNENVNILRNLYGMRTLRDHTFDGDKVSQWLGITWSELDSIQKIILELVYFEEWQFIKDALRFPSLKDFEDPIPNVQIFDRSINRPYFCWIENSADPVHNLPENTNNAPGLHLHNAANYINFSPHRNILDNFMRDFGLTGSGQFMDSVVPELLNQLDQAVDKWPSENAPYERPWNYFFRIASILWRKAIIGPMTIHLDLTSRCNTKCSFCGYHSPLIKERVWAHSGWQNLDLSMRVFEQLHRELELLGGSDEVLLIGGGEPILHKHSSTIIEKLGSSKMNPFLFTNGLVIGKQVSEQLLQAGLSKFYWSIHAADESTWMALHPGSSKGQFTRILTNLSDFIQLKHQRARSTRVIVIHALCKLNYTQVKEMIIQSRDLGVDELRFQLMQPVCNELHKQLPSQQELNWIKMTIEQALDNNLQGQMVVEANIQWQLERKDERLKSDSPEIQSRQWIGHNQPTTLPQKLDLKSRVERRTNTVLKNSKGSRIRSRCYAGFFILRSFVDGRLSYCFHDRIVGDLKSNSLFEIWCSEDYQKLRTAGLSMRAEQNINLWDGHKGNWLVAEDCASCSNYELQARVEHSLRKTGWWIYLHPETL